MAAFAVVGMGSMLAATTRSPLLAMIMVFEISLDYSLMPPLMLACVVSILVARRLHPESIYTEPLRRKGLVVRQESTDPGAATERTVGDLMRAPVAPVRENATLKEIADRFLTSANNFLPVVDAKQQLVGVVALQDLKEYLEPGGVERGDCLRRDAAAAGVRDAQPAVAGRAAGGAGERTAQHSGGEHAQGKPAGRRAAARGSAGICSRKRLPRAASRG